MTLKKQIFSFFSFIINDIRTDIKAIKHIIDCSAKGTPIFGEKTRANWREYRDGFTVGRFLKDNWMGFVMCLLYGVIGWWLASIYYQNVCNEIIYNNYIASTPVVENIGGFLENLTMIS